ncbi:MAG: hypothetical protein LUB63_01375, partial [Oscillospiraceae bacterium]|nr:hypothetical protein [Oscillospiraceae bacterium]
RNPHNSTNPQNNILHYYTMAARRRQLIFQSLTHMGCMFITTHKKAIGRRVCAWKPKEKNLATHLFVLL